MEAPFVIVGCSTIPSRLKYLPRVLDQVKKQTVRPDLFCVGIPEYSTREKVPYDVDAAKEFLSADGLDFATRVVVLDQDYGPLCKLAGMLAVAPPSSVLITIDDDHEYDPSLVETLLGGMTKYQNSVICLCGHALGRIVGDVNMWGYRQTGFDCNPIGKAVQLDSGDRVDIISGWAGVLYPRDLLVGRGPPRPDGVPSLPTELEFYRRYGIIKKLHQNDDLYISAWLSRLRVPRVVISYPGKYRQAMVKEINDVNPLCQSGHANWYKGHVVHFVEWWGIIKDLHQHGFFEETAPVAPHKSFALIGCIGVVVVVGVVAVVALHACRRAGKKATK